MHYRHKGKGMGSDWDGTVNVIRSGGPDDVALQGFQRYMQTEAKFRLLDAAGGCGCRRPSQPYTIHAAVDILIELRSKRNGDVYRHFF